VFTKQIIIYKISTSLSVPLTVTLKKWKLLYLDNFNCGQNVLINIHHCESHEITDTAQFMILLSLTMSFMFMGNLQVELDCKVTAVESLFLLLKSGCEKQVNEKTDINPNSTFCNVVIHMSSENPMKLQ